MTNPDPNPEDEAFEELALKQGHWQHTSGWRKKQIQVAQPEQERNFCSRCGKRTKDLTHIHTCTPPPKENT